jgi:hypothetical protein
MDLDPPEMGEKEGRQMKLPAAIHREVFPKPRRACPVVTGAGKLHYSDSVIKIF